MRAGDGRVGLFCEESWGVGPRDSHTDFALWAFHRWPGRDFWGRVIDPRFPLGGT